MEKPRYSLKEQKQKVNTYHARHYADVQQVLRVDQPVKKTFKMPVTAATVSINHDNWLEEQNKLKNLEALEKSETSLRELISILNRKTENHNALKKWEKTKRRQYLEQEQKKKEVIQLQLQQDQAVIQHADLEARKARQVWVKKHRKEKKKQSSNQSNVESRAEQNKEAYELWLQKKKNETKKKASSKIKPFSTHTERSSTSINMRSTVPVESKYSSPISESKVFSKISSEEDYDEDFSECEEHIIVPIITNKEKDEHDLIPEKEKNTQDPIEKTWSYNRHSTSHNTSTINTFTTPKTTHSPIIETEIVSDEDWLK